MWAAFGELYSIIGGSDVFLLGIHIQAQPRLIPEEVRHVGQLTTFICPHQENRLCLPVPGR
jgi:hypothetical protein